MKLDRFLPFSDNFGRTKLGASNDIKKLPKFKFDFDATYELCYGYNNYYQESFSARISVRLQGTNRCHPIKDGNPLVNVSDDEGLARYMITLPDMDTSSFVRVDDETYDSVYWHSFQEGDEYLLADNETLSEFQCTILQNQIWDDPKRSYPIAPIFGKTRDENGTSVYMLYDPRLVFHENTPENPLPDGGGQVTIDTDGAVLCSNAPRTPFNEDDCFLSTNESACSAATQPTFSIILNDETLQGFYTWTKRYIYAIDNLPFDNNTDETLETYLEHPCDSNSSQYSRWERMKDLSSCEGDDYLIVGSGTAAIFSTLLQDGFAEDSTNPNPRLKDVERQQTQTCNETDFDRYYLGYIKTTTDGGVETCWHHVHPLHLNVYDMTKFTEPNQHIGGPDKIKKWAETYKAETGILYFPSHHHHNGNERFFDTIANHPNDYPLIGKLDQAIPYLDLPLNLQVRKVREKYVSVCGNDVQHGVVVCGSRGEVANDPSLGSGFDVDKDDDLEDDTTRFRNRQR